VRLSSAWKVGARFRVLTGRTLALFVLALASSGAALTALALFANAAGAQEPSLSASEARESAVSVPGIAELAQSPEVDATAAYKTKSGEWRVLLTGGSGETVARVTVSDESGEIQGREITPAAANVDRPELTEDEAVKLAESNPEIRTQLSGGPPYSSAAEYKDGEWTVHFWSDENGDGEREEVARAGIDDSSWEFGYVYTGEQVGWQMARGDNGAYGKQANAWWVWGPMALVFALAFLRNDKLLSLRNLDVLALTGFLVSHGFFREGISGTAVILWYIPLVYLLVRTLLMGFGVGERVEGTSNFPPWLLFVLAGAASVVVLGLNIDSRVIDVGYAGVVGADRILDGVIPYGNMPSDVGTGDTYGPLNYILYIPFVLIFGFEGEWGYLPAAHALTNLAFVAGAVGMLYAGGKLAGKKGAAAMVFAWAIFPYTLYSTNNNTNDILVAAVAALGLAGASSGLARGASVAAGFAVKLFPLVLGPLWLLHGGPKRRPIADFVLGGAAVVVASFWVLLLAGGGPLEGARLFVEKTLLFQGERDTPWSIYGQIPWLSWLKTPLTAAVVLAGFVVAVFPRRRTVRRLAAFSAALVIGFQLTVTYWFYAYITWFEPFIFLALLLGTNQKSALDGAAEDSGSPEEGPPKG
jgi:hypothetical protein